MGPTRGGASFAAVLVFLMPIIVANVRRWKRTGMGVRRSSIWAARRLIYFMSGRSTASRSDSIIGALTGARRTFVWGFLTVRYYLISRSSSFARRVDGVKVYVRCSLRFAGRARETTTPACVARAFVWTVTPACPGARTLLYVHGRLGSPNILSSVTFC